MNSVILYRFCLPLGKADESALSTAKSRLKRGSSASSRVCSSSLRLHPWRLESGASTPGAGKPWLSLN